MARINIKNIKEINKERNSIHEEVDAAKSGLTVHHFR